MMRGDFITLLNVDCRSEVSAKDGLCLVAASLVWIEQQLTHGDENDGANDRRKEYGGEGNG
jgi:hypothetical protein